MSSKEEIVFVVGERVQYYSKFHNTWLNAQVVNIGGINIKFEADLTEMHVEDPENSELVRRYAESDRRSSRKSNKRRRLELNASSNQDSILVLFN